jgi:hypothetical protein
MGESMEHRQWGGGLKNYDTMAQALYDIHGHDRESFFDHDDRLE